MHYIATVALVVIAGCMYCIYIDITLIRRAIVDFTDKMQILNVNVLFNPEIVELIRNWRRSPRGKKETV